MTYMNDTEYKVMMIDSIKSAPAQAVIFEKLPEDTAPAWERIYFDALASL